MSSKKGAKNNGCETIEKLQILAYFLIDLRMRGRDSYRVGSATSIQEQQYAVYRSLPVLKSGLRFFSKTICSLQFRFLKTWWVCLTLFLYVGHF